MKNLFVLAALLFLPVFLFGQNQNFPSGNGGGSAFVSGPPGTGYQDVTEIAAPANPAAGVDRIYTSSVTHVLTCLTSGGGNCLTGGLPTGLTFVAPTLTVSTAGSGSGCVALSGNTSGTVTLCAPTVAGTATNPIQISNSLQLPSGTVYNLNGDTGLSRDSAGVVDVGNGTAGNKSGTLNAAVLSASSSISTGSSTVTACAGATGCQEVSEASVAATTTAGRDTMRADSTSHSFKCTLNGGAETACDPLIAGDFGGTPAAPQVTGTHLSSPLPVAQGGTALASGTSGGIPCFTGSTTMGSSVALTVNLVLKGGGAGACPGLSSITDNGTTIASAEPIVLGTANCTTFGTAGGFCLGEGTAPTNVATTAAIYADSTAHELEAATNGSASFGLLVRTQPGAINQTSKTAAITTATLCAASAGACNVAGQYHVHWNFWGSGTACSSVTAGSVTFLLTWTDENATAHSAVALQMMGQAGAATEAMGSTFPFQTSLANESGSGDFTLSTNGSVIQYATGYTACTTGTGTYNLRATVTRLQ